MSQINEDTCFLLHQRSYGETSIIAELFTKKNGKISVIAKGAKKPKSKFFGYLVPFHKLNISYSGRSELKTLTHVDRNILNSRSTMNKTSYSLLYINELLIRLLPKGAKQEELFELYENFLEKIKANNVELVLRSFELDLLDILGYGFDYQFEIEKNTPIKHNAMYSFVPERGFKESKNSKFSGQDVINLKNRHLEDVPLKELKKITKQAINYCLDGNDLASREIFKKLMR
ncbi:MAG: DNA repair protein RecO [Gammaproteobacteria bacterium]|nr:DNA repair protein RecO [Gammaproteobacteria bacterium]